MVARNNHNTSYSSNYNTYNTSPIATINTDITSENNDNINKNSAKTAMIEKLTIDNAIDAVRNATGDENKSDYFNTVDYTIRSYTKSTRTIEKSL